MSLSDIKGYDNGNFGPSDTITREQAMTMIARAAKLTGLDVSLTDGDVSVLLGAYTDGASDEPFPVGFTETENWLRGVVCQYCLNKLYYGLKYQAAYTLTIVLFHDNFMLIKYYFECPLRRNGL